MNFDWTFLAQGFFLVVFLAFARARMLTYLHCFQQEEYNGWRFLRWIIAKRAFDRRATLVLLAAGLFKLVPILPEGRFLMGLVVAVLGLVLLTTREPDPRQHPRRNHEAGAKRLEVVQPIRGGIARRVDRHG